MSARRSRRARLGSWAWIGGAALALAAGTAWAEEEAGADSGRAVPVGFSYSVEATSSYHYVRHAYFGADWGITDDSAKHDYTWGEGFTRVRLNRGTPEGVWISAGGVLLGTAGTDYFGIHDAGDAVLDQLQVGYAPPGGDGVGFVAGRQDLQIGDGFLIGDGFYDRKAALWNIPLSFYDALRADWRRGPWHALAFGARLSPSYGDDGAYPGSRQGGGEAGWSGSEARSLALGWFGRADDGSRQIEARALSLRGGWDRGPLAVAGELVAEYGRVAGADLKARGGHANLTYTPGLAGEPYVQAEYFLFSGDDPATPEQEGYYPWNYRWTDWSRYYVADLVASTLIASTDSRIWKIECGVTPRENTSLRLLAHRLDLDTGASYGGLPAGVGRGFADEVDLVVDQSFGGRWSAWVMGGYARPREAGKALVGAAASGQMFVSVTYKLEGPGGSGD